MFHSLLGISWLWFFGSIFLTSFTPFAKIVLGGDENVVTLLLAVFSIGIGVGALACERLSGRKVEIGLVPFGSIGMTLFAVDLWLATRGMTPGPMRGVGAFVGEAAHWRVMADLFLLALFGGLFSVPLYALIQSRSEPTHRARIIAANNILNALFMIVASLMATALLDAGLTLPQLFLVVGLMNAAVAAYIYLLVPEFLMRFICWLLIHSVYRLEKKGVDNIPEEGAAVLVCNHVSFVDPLVILAASPRPIRFVMDHRIFRTPVLSFVFRTGKAIPIAPAKEDERAAERGVRQGRRGARARRAGRDLPRRAHHRYGRALSVPRRHPAHRRAHAGARRSHGAEGPVGQLLQPPRRGGHDAAFPARRAVAHRARGGAAGAARDGDDPESLQATVQAMRGDWSAGGPR